MFLRKYKIVSGASRNIVKINSKWFLKKKFTQLLWTKKSKAGRTNTGRISVWSKGSILKKVRFPKINYNFRYSNIIFISTFQLIPFQNKLVSLCFLSTGGVTYLQSTTQFRIFDFFKAPLKIKNQLNHIIQPIVSLLVRIKLLSKTSLLELYPGSGVQYVRSSGSSARFLNINWLNHTALIILPSGVRKSFSLYSIASIGAVDLKIKRLLRNTKAGFWVTYGNKSRTRGVAMNPVDHPHGGRTKTIKNPRTPWGKPTKKK